MTNDDVFNEVIDNMQLHENMTVLEFGVASGNTLLSFLNMLKRRSYTPVSIVGFDSFEGLPEEEVGIQKHESWHKGAFELLRELKESNETKKTCNSKDEGIEFVRKRFKEAGHDVNLVIGFYEQTLTKDVAKNISPASYVHIDVDLYVSAKQVLTFLFDNNLIAENCIIRYDDWNVSGFNIGEFGESKAHKEICEKYNITFERINNKNGTWGSLFRYKGLNNA